MAGFKEGEKRPAGNEILNRQGPLVFLSKESSKFLERMSSVMNIDPTPQERERTRVILRDIYSANEEENKSFYDGIVDKIVWETGVETKIRGKNKFKLVLEPIKFGFRQKNNRTSIMFLPENNMPLDPDSFYELFFHDLPRSLFGKEAPRPGFIKDVTRVDYVMEDRNPAKQTSLFLRSVSDRHKFEYQLESLEEISWFTMHYSSDAKTSFKLRVPNPINKPNKLMEFAYPSAVSLNDQTLNLLLDFHRDRIEPDEAPIYVRSLTEASNILSAELRKKSA
jgi:hypothetical protein